MIANKICPICNKNYKTKVIDKLTCSSKCLSLYRALNLQKMYTEGKITPTKICDEAFYEITNFMKSELSNYLIKKGYFINGVRQDNFDSDLLIDCYVYVMDHVFGKHIKRSGKQSYVKYDSERLNLASFINIWTKGFCSLTRQRQRNEYKINKHRILYLDEITETYIPEELIEDEFINNLSNNLEREIFSTNVNTKIFEDLSYELSEELEDIYIDWN